MSGQKSYNLFANSSKSLFVFFSLFFWQALGFKLRHQLISPSKEYLFSKHRKWITLDCTFPLILNGMIIFPLSLPKFAKLSFNVRRLWGFFNSPVPHWKVLCFATIFSSYPILFYCNFPWPSSQGLENTISRCLKLIAKCSGISSVRLHDFLISKHLISCELFANEILSDVQHPTFVFIQCLFLLSKT